MDTVDAATVVDIERLLKQLASEPRPGKMATGSDFFEHEILWQQEDQWTTRTIHDQTATGNERALVELLRKLRDS
jgi:hypothetical protein